MNKRTAYPQLAQRLYELRVASHRSQNEIAEYCGLERSTYSCYELGKTVPSLMTLVKLARLYGVSVDYLLKSGIYDQENSFSHQFECKEKKTKK